MQVSEEIISNGLFIVFRKLKQSQQLHVNYSYRFKLYWGFVAQLDVIFPDSIKVLLQKLIVKFYLFYSKLHKENTPHIRFTFINIEQLLKRSRKDTVTNN